MSVTPTPEQRLLDQLSTGRPKTIEEARAMVDGDLDAIGGYLDAIGPEAQQARVIEAAIKHFDADLEGDE